VTIDPESLRITTHYVVATNITYDRAYRFFPFDVNGLCGLTAPAQDGRGRPMQRLSYWTQQGEQPWPFPTLGPRIPPSNSGVNYDVKADMFVWATKNNVTKFEVVSSTAPQLVASTVFTTKIPYTAYNPKRAMVYLYTFGTDGWLYYQAVYVRRDETGMWNSNPAGANMPLSGIFVDDELQRILYVTSGARSTYGVAGAPVLANGEAYTIFRDWAPLSGVLTSEYDTLDDASFLWASRRLLTSFSGQTGRVLVSYNLDDWVEEKRIEIDFPIVSVTECNF